jgi:hypothetical protein
LDAILSSAAVEHITIGRVTLVTAAAVVCAIRLGIIHVFISCSLDPGQDIAAYI